MFVGINESGKSNILEAMSYFDTPDDEFDYNVLHNQKDEGNNPVDLWFYLEFEQKQTCLNELRKGIENGDLLYFEIENIVKNVYLQHGEDSFDDDFLFDIKKLSQGLFIKKTQKNITNAQGQQIAVNVFTLSKENDEEESFQELTNELFLEYFSDKIKNIIKKYTPSVSFWRPSDKYLVSEVDLNEFKDDIDSNIPLKHIFYIAGFKNKESISVEIEKISNDSLRRKLAGTLGDKVTKYVKNIWKHNIIIDIEIAESGRCVVSVRDGGKDNEFNYHKMSVRSEGFKQFMSLILSLSVETKMTGRKNNLILIDEPEAHLHPSGIRDLRNELLEIDKNTNIIDDEVLREAFGIEVYKDLLNPHSVLVEGASDKKILQKAFAIRGLDKYGITNGHGSNIDTLASKLNDTDISILIVLDDDQQGKEYKEKIIKIGDFYSQENVVTIRDLVGDIIDNGTIEDTLGVNFIKGKTCEVYKKTFGEECDMSLSDTQPFIEQIRAYLHQKKKNKKIIEKFLKDLKIQIADDFAPAKSSFTTNFPLLNSLIDKIQSKLEQK